MPATDCYNGVDTNFITCSVPLWVPSHCSIPGNETADRLAKQGAAGDQDNTVSFQEMKTLDHQAMQPNSKADSGLPSADQKGAGSHPPAANRPPAHAQEISSCIFTSVPLWQSGAVSTTCLAGLPEPSAAEEGLLARGNNNAEQAVRDHRQSAEDSFVHHHYWSPSVVTSKRKEEDHTSLTSPLVHTENTQRTASFITTTGLPV